MRVLIAAVALLGVVTSCAYRATPVPLGGDRAAIAKLAGEWTGMYNSTETGRTGSISFSIRAGGDSAFGDVMMEWPDRLGYVRHVDASEAHLAHARGPSFLAIQFVEVAGGAVEGLLEPYVAPDCECVVSTRFRGYVVADTVAGVFVTRAPGGREQAGTWRVTRHTP